MTHLVIIGAGPAGLLLARVLTQGGQTCTVLERDQAPDARSQGGSLDLHPETGQRALALAGLDREFWALARSEGEELRILGPDGVECVHHHGGGTRPEIDRADLRRLLVESLPPRTIRWGRRVVSVGRRTAGGFTLALDDGSTMSCDVLVGADGAWSRVRGLLTDVEPQDLGIRYAELWLRDVGSRPDLDTLVGRGSLWCLGDNLNVGAQRSSRGDARVSVMARRELPSTRDALLEVLAGWSPRIRALVEAADDHVVVRPLASLPSGHVWDSRPDVTLVGDAADLMPPVGEGANQALLDGAELGRRLLARPGDPAAAIRRYEEDLHARIGPVADESARVQAALLSTDSLTAMTRMFAGARAGA